MFSKLRAMFEVLPTDVGPVFRVEARRLVSHRVWYLLRILVLAAAAGFTWVAHRTYLYSLDIGVPRRLIASMTSDWYSDFFAAVGLVLAFLIAPLAAVGAFDARRGKYMLPLLLVTRLEGREIIWQAFAAALVPGLMLWTCLLPFALFFISFWGCDPIYLAMAAAVIFCSMCAWVASAVAFSLWSGGLYSTILGVYALWLSWLYVTLMFNLSWLYATLKLSGSGVVPVWIRITNPFVLVFQPSGRLGRPAWADVAFFVAGAALFTIVMLEIAAATFRSSVLARGRVRHGKMARIAGAIAPVVCWRPAGIRVPTLDGNPILWREWQHSRHSLGVQAFWLLYVVGAAITTFTSARSYIVGPGVQPILAAVAGYELGIGALALAIQASLIWSEEKSAGREGVDLLLATPLSAKAIINGKWRAVFRFSAPVVFFPVLAGLLVLSDPTPSPALDAGLFSTFTPLAIVPLVLAQTLCYAATFVSLGVLLATRCRKPAHAVFWTVGLYVAVTVVAPTFAEILFLPFDRPLAAGLALVSPIAAPIETIMTRFPGPYFGPAEFVYPYAAVWLVVVAGAGWILYRWSIGQFDRRMGRIAAADRRSGPETVRALADPECVQPARDHRSARE